MDSPLTYPDQRQGDNLVVFFFNLIGALLKGVLLALMALLFEFLA